MGVITCPRCGKENEQGNDYCGRCGLEFAQYNASRPAPDGEQHYCYRHKNEPTNLSCGRCGRYLCHRCVVIGPAGPRCRDCARHKVPVTARAVVGDAKIGLSRLFRGGPYMIYFWLLLAGMVFGMVRGCMYEFQRPRYYSPPPQERPAPTTSSDQSV